MDLTPRQQRIYDIIANAARAGKVCPTNKAIAKMEGLTSASAVADIIARLQRKGVIEVERFNRSRIIYLVDLDLETAPPSLSSLAGHAPHWRLREPGVDYSDKPGKRPRPFPPPAAWRRKWPRARWHPARCQYLYGSSRPDEIDKCGLPVAKGSSYCVLHHALCYSVHRSNNDRREER